MGISYLKMIFLISPQHVDFWGQAQKSCSLEQYLQVLGKFSWHDPYIKTFLNAGIFQPLLKRSLLISTPPCHPPPCPMVFLQACIIIHFISYWLIDFKFFRGSSGLSGRSIEYLISFFKSTREKPQSYFSRKKKLVAKSAVFFSFPRTQCNHLP